MTSGGTKPWLIAQFGLLLVLDLGAAAPVVGQEQETGKREQAILAIQAAKTVTTLETFLSHRDATLRRAAILRLGALGGPAVVAPLVRAFETEPRLVGADAPAGLRREILGALARSGAQESSEVILRLLRAWRQEGPRHKGPYAHIYDSQYFAVIREGIRSVEVIPSQDTMSFLADIEKEDETFYLLREEAAAALLRMEMAERSLTADADRAVFLLERIESGGVPGKGGWTGPGKKSAKAVRQNAVEDLLSEFGPAVTAPVLAALERNKGGDPGKRLVLSRILMNTVDEEGVGLPVVSRALEASLSVLESLPEEDDSFADTVAGIYRIMIGAADRVADRELWARLKAVSERVILPGAWKGPAPTRRDLLLPVPEGSVFLAGRSRKVATPYGDLITAWFLHRESAEKIVRFYEEQMRMESREERVGEDAVQGMCHVFDLPLPPAKISRLLRRGVTVFVSEKGFEERAFGKVAASGKTLIRIIR